MKLLLVINSLSMGGAEQLVSQLMVTFQKRPVQPQLLVMSGSGTPLAKQLKEQGIEAEFMELKSLYNPLNIWKLRKYLKGYDLVHVHLFPALYWTALAKSLSGMKAPLLFTEHSTYNKRRSHKLGKILDRWIYRKYRHIVCITNEVAQNLKDHIGSNGPSFSVIPNGIDIDRFEQATALDRSIFGIDPGDKILIQVSSFREAKDQQSLINALPLLPSSSQLLLVGEGPTQEACRVLVEQLGLDERVQFLGIRTDIPELLKMSDYVLLSTHYEGMSLACIEGMASGRPFVASKVPGVIDLVEGHGILFDSQDPKDLAAKILGLEKDQQAYDQVVARCRQRAREFSIDKTAEEHINLYQNLCDAKS